MAYRDKFGKLCINGVNVHSSEEKLSPEGGTPHAPWMLGVIDPAKTLHFRRCDIVPVLVFLCQFWVQNDN